MNISHESLHQPTTDPLWRESYYLNLLGSDLVLETTILKVTQVWGIAASAGSGPTEGVAVVTNDPLDAGRRLLELKEPVVLVTRLTDPAWSSLFSRLNAVVTELGGVISHAAIVARENGLPAVVGVPEVTRRVRNGQRVRVDGASGIVEVLE
jgi:phosphohistidine swiveling domain-containing protein